MKKTLWFIAVVFIALVVYGAFLSNKRSAIIQDAYNQGIKCIDLEAKALKTWMLSGKNGTAKAASDLSGPTAKWKYATLSNEEFAYYASQVIAHHTHSSEQIKARLEEGISDCISDIYQIEINLADKAGKELNLNTTEQASLRSSIAIMPIDVSRDVQNAVLGDITSQIYGAVAEQLLVSAGILGTSTALSVESFGISLAIGVGLDLIISWFMDTEGNIQDKLNSSIEQSAVLCEKVFREEMQEKLDERRRQWEEAIPIFGGS